MLGILVALAISWILLHFIEKKSILALGLTPVLTRMAQFAIGFLITLLLCFCVQFLESGLKSAQWVINPDFTVGQFFKMLYWDFKSVLFEELLFRGALLYILIRRTNASVAIAISAIAFGVYHWFTFGILGNIIPMIFVFIGTGLMGYAWALAFHKTRSIALATGLHLGWNFTLNTLFSRGPLGEGFLIQKNDQAISDWYSLVGLWLVPLIVFLIVKFYTPNHETN